MNNQIIIAEKKVLDSLFVKMEENIVSRILESLTKLSVHRSYSVSEAAKVSRKSFRTIKRAIGEKKLFVSTDNRITEQELLRYLETPKNQP